ncbi:MAG: UDP-N-acetylmuramate dehydrogenase [Polyangiaceae bacterium]
MSDADLVLARDVPLAPLTTMGVGGPATMMATVTSEVGLRRALEHARDEGLETFVLGAGSNLVVADRGLHALVLRLELRGLHITREGSAALVEVGAGEPWDAFVARAVSERLVGVECLSGIPGRVGATPIQNVGAYGQEVSDTIESVTAVERATGERVVFEAAALAFAYRDSFFKRAGRGRFIVTSVAFRLAQGETGRVRYGELSRALNAESAPIAEIRERVIALRRAKSMVFDEVKLEAENNRSAGSFFMNPIVDAALADAVAARAGAATMPRFPVAGDASKVKLAAGWLIEQAGLVKGTARGRVGLSTRHALAVVNRGGATARELVDFARMVQETVEDRLGVRIEVEPELVGFDPAELDPLVRAG